MVLSSDELEILEYLKSWKGAPVSLVEICRCAGGRKKYKETPQWARPLMSRLVEANLVLVNDRGHYRVPEEAVKISSTPTKETKSPEKKTPPTVKLDRWMSPQMEEILRKSGKKFQG